MSLSRGAFKFTRGAWHRIGVRVVLNAVGKANGIVEISLNGQRKIYYDKVNYRTSTGWSLDGAVGWCHLGGWVAVEGWGVPGLESGWDGISVQ